MTLTSFDERLTQEVVGFEEIACQWLIVLTKHGWMQEMDR